MSKQRNSSLELLKLVAVMLIVFSHAQPKYGAFDVAWRISLSEATTSIQTFIIIIMDYFGQIGNAVFIICSSWFLIGNKKGASSIKISRMLADTWGLSLLCWGGNSTWLSARYKTHHKAVLAYNI